MKATRPVTTENIRLSFQIIRPPARVRIVPVVSSLPCDSRSSTRGPMFSGWHLSSGSGGAGSPCPLPFVEGSRPALGVPPPRTLLRVTPWAPRGASVAASPGCSLGGLPGWRLPCGVFHPWSHGFDLSSHWRLQNDHFPPLRSFSICSLTHF